MSYTYHFYNFSSDADGNVQSNSRHSSSHHGADDIIDYNEYQSDEKARRESHRLWLVLALTALTVIILGLLYSLNIIPHRRYTNADFDIPNYYSATDKDNDGLDDQSDILASAWAYLDARPQYKSVYYAGGYPDDEYGVCTDVVAFALKGAGYDLMELVDTDIRANPSLYDVETPDANIDFRRVKNLEVWFRRHAKSLTTDVKDLAEWQGGDIVIFKDHIGIVSDKRNRNGVPFLIHHYSPVQASYEEDVLENYQVIGHYRIS